ncbi:hypothetical protein UFOVP1169_53 [uncultured Caudovirales phage]|uniref:Holin n=1 Tax=uncultured Caudovirales phage TaxID=2100421 RepID=A0A6J5QU68_9CAUD|nr:hypothetical protein UFOVP1169_53 [uncultured Caudovirales phage]
METTKWYLSKTLWINVVATVATLAGVFKIDLGLTPEVQATVVTTILALVNIALRLVTKTAIVK